MITSNNNNKNRSFENRTQYIEIGSYSSLLNVLICFYLDCKPRGTTRKNQFWNHQKSGHLNINS